MDNIIVITQNLKLNSLEKVKDYISDYSETLIVSTQLLFENEREFIDSTLNCKCQYLNFSDLLTDSEEMDCDVLAYNEITCNGSLQDYYDLIKEIKNKKVIENINKTYFAKNKLILCDDLGININIWLNAGYRYIKCAYYHTEKQHDSYNIVTKDKRSKLKKILSKIKIHTYNRFYLGYKYEIRQILKKDISVGYSQKQKYLFFGSMNRISYRLNIRFTQASTFEKLRYFLDKRGINTQPNTIRLSTLHEGFNAVPDKPYLKFKLIQDGYLPPNYTSKYLNYYGKFTEFYTWDSIGQLTFKYHQLPSQILPIRRKLYLPKPYFPKKIKKVLCVASGAGDWTAIKNRSDEDKMLQAFGKIAQKFPEIEFVYRCHPVWVHPQHQGVNSIIRAGRYIDWLNLPNFKISCNIPSSTDSNGNFILSYKRTSLEEDLKDVDVVFGEHSISMIDAAFKNILFCSVNVTGRRNLFAGITELGFPHCECLSEISEFINNINTCNFQNRYNNAIDNYNAMTDKE